MTRRKPWADRGSRHERGYGALWDKARKQRLELDRYLCQPCLKAGRTTAATEVHHLQSKADGGTDDLSNLLSSCSSCHQDLDLANRGHTKRVVRVVGLDGYPLDEPSLPD